MWHQLLPPLLSGKKKFSHHLLWARTGKMNVCTRGRGLLWLVSLSHDSSARVRPFCYHKQQWGSISKKGGELLGGQLSVYHDPLLYQTQSVVWDGHTVGSPTLLTFPQPSPSLSPLNWPLLICTDRFLVKSYSSLRSHWIVFMRPSWTYVPVLGMSILATTTNWPCHISCWIVAASYLCLPLDWAPRGVVIYICHIHIPKTSKVWELKKEFWSML